MNYIYIDVLIITNIYVNYFLLKATARFTHNPLKLKRCIVASLVGAVLSVGIVFSVGTLLLTALKLISMILIIITAFCPLSLKRFIRVSLVFIGVTFLFGGIMQLICQLTNAKIIVVHNLTVYFDISMLTLAISTILAYIAVCIIAYILESKCNLNHSYKVVIELLGKKLSLRAVADTGNTLIDVFTGKPVIVCSSDELRHALCLDNNRKYEAGEYLDILQKMKGLRIMPYSTIGNEGIIPAFLVDKLIIENENNEAKEIDAYIAISQSSKGEFEAIFNPRLLI